jgi:hypothetical protein
VAPSSSVTPTSSTPITKESIGVSSRKKPVFSNYGKVEQSKPAPAPAATGINPTSEKTPTTAGSSPATGAISSTTQAQKNAVSPPAAKKKPRRRVVTDFEPEVGGDKRKKDAQDFVDSRN